MIETLFSVLHVAPLVVITSMILINAVLKLNLVKQELYNPVLLILSSIGIASGAVVHDHDTIMLIDPCFAYAATLVFVAASLVSSSCFSKTSRN